MDVTDLSKWSAISSKVAPSNTPKNTSLSKRERWWKYSSASSCKSTCRSHDLVFGLGHTIVSFAISALIFKSVKDVKTRMFVLAGVFSVMIFLVAIELNLVLELPFWLSYAQTFFGEIVVLLAGVPLMTALNKAIDLKKLIND